MGAAKGNAGTGVNMLNMSGQSTGHPVDPGQPGPLRGWNGLSGW